jgi:hypothetical protein
MSWRSTRPNGGSDRWPYNLLFVNDLRSLFAVSEPGSSPDLASADEESVAAPFPRWNAARSNLARFLATIRLLEFGAPGFSPFGRRLGNQERSDRFMSELAWLHSHPAS